MTAHPRSSASRATLSGRGTCIIPAWLSGHNANDLLGAFVAVAGTLGTLLAGGGGGAPDTITGPPTASAATAAAPAPIASTAQYLDSVGPTPSARESTSLQTTDAIGPAEGRHRIGARIWDHLIAGGASMLGLDAPQSDGEWAVRTFLLPGPTYGMVTGAIHAQLWLMSPMEQAATGRALRERVEGAWDAHLAGDDGALDDVVADATSTAWLATASVMTGRVVGGVVAGDVAAAQTGGATALAEGAPALAADEAAVATGTDASNGLEISNDLEVGARGPGGRGRVVVTQNPSGGTVVTSTGRVRGLDFDPEVRAAVARGDRVDILSGTHGTPNGFGADAFDFVLEDIELWGGLPGVHVHDITLMTDMEITGILRTTDTAVGAFCYSGTCLAGYF